MDTKGESSETGAEAWRRCEDEQDGEWSGVRRVRDAPGRPLALFGMPWDALGLSLAPFEWPWRPLWVPWCDVGVPLAPFGVPWSPFGCPWGPPWPSWGCLGASSRFCRKWDIIFRALGPYLRSLRTTFSLLELSCGFPGFPEVAYSPQLATPLPCAGGRDDVS